MQQDRVIRLVWVTDPHLNHVPVYAWDHWVDSIKRLRPDGIVITGDISEGDDVAFQLERIAAAFAVDIYFVLGNHDFYQSSISQTRERIVDLCRDHRLLHYLTDMAPVELADGVYLVGEDGWGDATQGNYERSPIRLNDFALIEEFKISPASRWKGMLQEQGKLSAERLRKKLDALPDHASEVIVATHVPPFRESCWYMGKTTDDDWAPFFVCGQVGESLMRHSSSRADRKLTVLCGHTHHDGIAKMQSNLSIYTGAADYGRPTVEALLNVSNRGAEIQLLRDDEESAT